MAASPQSKIDTAPDRPTTRKRTKVVIALIVLLLLVGSVSTVFLASPYRTDIHRSKIEDLQRQLAYNALSPEARREAWRQLDEALAEQDIAASEARPHSQKRVGWQNRRAIAHGGYGGRNGRTGGPGGVFGNGGDFDRGGWAFGNGSGSNPALAGAGMGGSAGIAGSSTGSGNIGSFFCPYYGKNLKLGRTAPQSGGPQFKMSDYVQGPPGSLPLTCDYFTAASQALSQIYLNDQLGDCAIAGVAHVVGVQTGNAGTAPFVFSSDQIVALYSAIGGYVPGDPNTDNGCDEVTALQYWQQQGAPAGSHQIIGWMAVDSQNPQEYRQALWLFENLYFGLSLPDSWLVNVAPGFVWQPDIPDPFNGHCVIGCGYDETGVKIATWGMIGTITDAAIHQVVTRPYHGHIYVVVSQDTINKATQKAPNGLNWNKLLADFKAMQGKN